MKLSLRLIAFICVVFLINMTITSCVSKPLKMSDASAVSTISSNENVEPKRIYCALLEGGWKPWVYILLYEDGLLEVYVTHCNKLQLCLDDSSESLVFSQKLSEEKFQEIKLSFDRLPDYQDEFLTSEDAWCVTILDEKSSFSFPLASEKNIAHANFVECLITNSIGNLNAVYDYVTP